MPERQTAGSAPEFEGEFLVFDSVSIRSGRTRLFPKTNWTWRHGEQWAILGPDGSGKSSLVSALLGAGALAGGEIRGPLGPGKAEVGPDESVAVVSPERQRALILAETTFYQSRWHSGLPEGQRTVAQFLSQAGVKDHNPYEI